MEGNRGGGGGATPGINNSMEFITEIEDSAFSPQVLIQMEQEAEKKVDGKVVNATPPPPPPPPSVAVPIPIPPPLPIRDFPMIPKKGEVHIVKICCANASKRRRMIDLSIRITKTIQWVLSQYIAVTVYSACCAFAAICNETFESYIKQCGEPLLLVSMCCFVVSLAVEVFPLEQMDFYSNLFNGLFLSGISMYFTVFPPFGMFQCTTLLAILTTMTIYATLFTMIKCETNERRRNDGSAQQRQQGSGLGCGLYLYGLTVIPSVIFLLSQILYFICVGGLEFDLEYGKYVANVVAGLALSMMLCYERFRFLYYYLKSVRDRFVGSETVLVTFGNRE